MKGVRPPKEGAGAVICHGFEEIVREEEKLKGIYKGLLHNT
jgi:hypothetical protein